MESRTRRLNWRSFTLWWGIGIGQDPKGMAHISSKNKRLGTDRVKTYLVFIKRMPILAVLMPVLARFGGRVVG